MIKKLREINIKVIVILIAVISIIAFLIAPDLFDNFLKGSNFQDILIIILYLPGLFILMGLIEVIIPKEFFIKKLGKNSGWVGSFYSFMLGSILPGPLYLSFPIAMVMVKKGVSLFNVALFVGAWSCFKIVEEVLELHFLGVKFMLLRIIITIPFVILTAYIIDRFHINVKQI